MERKEIRLLRADEIECRVATISEKGVQLLLYKDARVDQKILDESFGLFNWDGVISALMEAFIVRYLFMIRKRKSGFQSKMSEQRDSRKKKKA